ncbi:hypothetical protein EKD04_014355 [Chloroflexales bacterium ZM16-3]|nr:hypothetical protein [Chloroflexales bacterium ZM16-3]
MTTLSGFVLSDSLHPFALASGIAVRFAYQCEELDLLADLVGFLREHRRRRLIREQTQDIGQDTEQARRFFVVAEHQLMDKGDIV